MMQATWRKLSEKLKNGIEIFVGQAVLKLLILYILINNY